MKSLSFSAQMYKECAPVVLEDDDEEQERNELSSRPSENSLPEALSQVMLGTTRQSRAKNCVSLPLLLLLLLLLLCGLLPMRSSHFWRQISIKFAFLLASQLDCTDNQSAVSGDRNQWLRSWLPVSCYLSTCCCYSWKPSLGELYLVLAAAAEVAA